MTIALDGLAEAEAGASVSRTAARQLECLVDGHVIGGRDQRARVARDGELGAARAQRRPFLEKQHRARYEVTAQMRARAGKRARADVMEHMT